MPQDPQQSETKPTDPLVDFKDVSKAYGSNAVLDNLCFSMPQGERVALIGPSGSGKTTVLRVLMGLERPDSGTVTVAGESVWHTERNGKRLPADSKHLRRVRRHVGMVFQQYNLFPHMTAVKNISEPLIRVRKMTREQADMEARQLLQKVGLVEHGHKKPSQLSGGQQQRVALARAIAMKPKVMLFDEVTSALDPELVGEVLKTIELLASETSMSMLIVTHEMTFAANVADRVMMFDKGVVVEQGQPKEVLQDPQHERTQRFLSSLQDRG